MGQVNNVELDPEVTQLFSFNNLEMKTEYHVCDYMRPLDYHFQVMEQKTIAYPKTTHNCTFISLHLPELLTMKVRALPTVSQMRRNCRMGGLLDLVSDGLSMYYCGVLCS